MLHLAPYIGFNGRTKEALDFYQQAFGGELEVQYVKDAPVETHMPAEQVFHAALIADGKIVMMASDMTSGAYVQGNMIALALMPDSPEEARNLFAHLREGGEVIEELAESAWGDLFGRLTDKYGINWMFNCSAK